VTSITMDVVDQKSRSPKSLSIFIASDACSHSLGDISKLLIHVKTLYPFRDNTSQFKTAQPVLHAGVRRQFELCSIRIIGWTSIPRAHDDPDQR
jgi:hypothetical protein